MLIHFELLQQASLMDEHETFWLYVEIMAPLLTCCPLCKCAPACTKSSQKGVGQENISVGTEQPLVSQLLAVVCTLIYSASHVGRKFSQQAVLADG